MTGQPLDRHSNLTERGLVTKPVHPLALLIPEMAPDQFDELREDIAAHGLHEAIVLHEDMVLDGRHRMRACDETGVAPRFVPFEGESPAEFVLSMNMKRRHLTPSQRAAVAVEFLPRLEEEARQRKATTQLAGREPGGRPIGPAPGTHTEGGHRAREDAGALVGVSGATVDRAKRVQREEPEMFEQVKAGAITVREADNAIRERKRETGDLAPANGNGKKPTRDGTYKRRSVDLVSNVIDRLANTPMALRELDLAGAVAHPNAPLPEWDQKLTDVIQSLHRLRSDIRKEMSK